MTLTADLPDDLLSHLEQAALTEGSSVDDLLARAVRGFLEQRDKIQAETVEGLQAIRRGELIDHSEVRGDFDNWGGVMARILWSQPARCDLLEIRSWNEQRHPDQAEREGQRLRTEIEKLASFPRLGRRIQGVDGGPEEIREFVVAPYVIRYVLDEDRVILIRLWHASRGPGPA